jgi:acyl-coenzyme A synthetase/AMP-(fatty) acid ligase
MNQEHKNISHIGNDTCVLSTLVLILAIYFIQRDLYRTMNRIANMFKHHGIKKGDCVAFYVHTSTYAVAAMLACARIGAIHMCIYAEFPPHAIAMRINEGVLKTTCQQYLRRNLK